MMLTNEKAFSLHLSEKWSLMKMCGPVAGVSFGQVYCLDHSSTVFMSPQNSSVVNSKSFVASVSFLHSFPQSISYLVCAPRFCVPQTLARKKMTPVQAMFIHECEIKFIHINVVGAIVSMV